MGWNRQVLDVIKCVAVLNALLNAQPTTTLYPLLSKELLLNALNTLNA